MELSKITNSGVPRALVCAVIALCFSAALWSMNESTSNNSSSSKSSFIESIARFNDPDDAQKSIRLYAKGDLDSCLDLYKEAKQRDNSIAQIYIANAFGAMHWAKDSTKNFNTLTAQGLEEYRFASDSEDLLGVLENKINPDLTWRESDRIKQDILDKAAKLGNTFAQSVIILNELGHYRYPNFATACKLKPLTEKNDVREVLYHYGRALYCAGLYNQKLELEGIACMAKSGKLKIIYADEQGNQSFSDYCSHYVQYNYNTYYYDRYGMLFAGNGTIVAPSRAHWDEFKRTILETRTPTADETFNVCTVHDLQKIALLKEKYGISFLTGSHAGGRPWLSMYIKKWGRSKEIGEIVATIDNDTITTENSIKLNESQTELQPAIAFAEDMMKRCAHGLSVESMFDTLKYIGEANALPANDAQGEAPQTYTVCLDDLNPLGTTSYVLSCHHVFHKTCIQRAVAVKRECPNCRETIYDTLND